MTLAALSNRDLDEGRPASRSEAPVAPPALLNWSGDTASLILEMKRLGGCETDSELAGLLGRESSAVAQWRKRKSVPERALLRLAILLGNAGRV